MQLASMPAGGGAAPAAGGGGGHVVLSQFKIHSLNR